MMSLCDCNHNISVQRFLFKMASRRRGFSVDEVIDQVCLDSGSNGDQESTAPSIEDVIKLSVDQFNPLGGYIGDITRFRRDATSCLENIYRRYEHGKCDEMEGVLLATVSVGRIIAAEVLSWMKSLHRRMVPTPKIRNLWCIEFSRDMPKEIFIHFRDAIRRGRSRFGVSCDESSVKFSHKNRLIRDFSKMTGLTQHELRQRFQKN